MGGVERLMPDAMWIMRIEWCIARIDSFAHSVPFLHIIVMSYLMFQ